MGEHLPLGLMAVFLLVFFVMALPLGTFIAVQRLVRGRLQLEMDDEAVDTALSDDKRLWTAFYPGDYEAEYFWVRHFSWAVLVIICVAKEYGQVPTHFFAPTKIVGTCACTVKQCREIAIFLFQSTIGSSVGVALLGLLHIGILLKLNPFRKEHRYYSSWIGACNSFSSVCEDVSPYSAGNGLEFQTNRWKVVPRVTLLACSVWAEMVNISQIASSSAAGPNQATVVLSAILFMAILLLVIMLPVAFFRAKVQDAREQAQFRKVFALRSSRA